MGGFANANYEIVKYGLILLSVFNSGSDGSHSLSMCSKLYCIVYSKSVFAERVFSKRVFFKVYF